LLLHRANKFELGEQVLGSPLLVIRGLRLWIFRLPATRFIGPLLLRKRTKDLVQVICGPLLQLRRFHTRVAGFQAMAGRCHAAGPLLQNKSERQNIRELGGDCADLPAQSILVGGESLNRGDPLLVRRIILVVSLCLSLPGPVRKALLSGQKLSHGLSQVCYSFIAKSFLGRLHGCTDFATSLVERNSCILRLLPRSGEVAVPGCPSRSAQTCTCTLERRLGRIRFQPLQLLCQFVRLPSQLALIPFPCLEVCLRW